MNSSLAVPSFADLLRAEGLRARTTRTTRASFLIGFVLVAILAALYGFFSREVVGSVTASGLDALADPGELIRRYLTGYSTGFMVAFVLGTFFVAGEMRDGRFAHTVLAEPRRGRLLLARAAVALGCGALLGVVLLGTSVVIVGAFALGQGAPLRLTEGVVAGRLLAALVGFPCWTAIGLGLGMVLRHQVATIAVGLGWILLVEVLITGVLLAIPTLAPVLPWLPRMASAAITGEAVAPGVDVLPLGTAVAVLAAWGAVLFGTGAVIISRSDVPER